MNVLVTALLSSLALAVALPAQLVTRFAADVERERPLPEHPRPQWVRDAWQSLNGPYDYAITPRDAPAPQRYDGTIVVPFPVESTLSGVARRVAPDQRLWYRRTFALPPRAPGTRTLLHFGAVDWQAVVTVNGIEVGRHEGGYDPFTFDITDALAAHAEPAAHELIVAVHDPTDAGPQPRGKQVRTPGGIWYTPVTGIWQSVWLEHVPPRRLHSARTSFDGTRWRMTVHHTDVGADATLQVEVRSGTDVVRRLDAKTTGSATTLDLTPERIRRWSPADPHLYDVTLRLRADAATLDAVHTYQGLRTIDVAAGADGIPRLRLNGVPSFQLGALDQGYWPDGLYTAPTDAALRSDVEFAKEIGFDMLRKHVKVEPSRWYHHCDRLGILVWQDMPNGDTAAKWSPDGAHDGTEMTRSPASAAIYERELRAMVEALREHPSVVVWVPFNEGWGQSGTVATARLLAELDPSRPVDAASGGNDFPVGDIRDLHDYPGPARPPIDGTRAIVLGEFGGLGLPVAGHLWQADRNWGYRTFADAAALTNAYVASIDRLRFLIDEGLSAAVYTQLTDVEIEVNGLLTYDRAKRKLDVAAARAAHARLAGPPRKIVPIVATSETQPQRWRYSLADVADEASDWRMPDFDDRSWREGDGGFGTKGTPGAIVRTTWDTSAIRLRRAVDVPAEPLHDPHLRIHHDEDVEVWLDGERIAQASGYLTAYAYIPVPKALLTPGRHVLAVRCRQTRGGQYVDVGIVDVR